MRVKRTQVVKIADIRANLFVRKELDTEHAMYLAELIENGVEMRDRIKLTEDLIIVDGRHRKEAYELANKKEIEVDIVAISNGDEVTLISEAYKANTGGSKPPTPADTEHTIMLLLERGESMKAIGEMLSLPAGMARRYANEVKSRMNRAKLQRAAAAVTDGGLTVTKAAEQYGVDSDKLKELLSGRRIKHKQGIADLQRLMSKLYHSLSTKNAMSLKRLIEKYQDGDVTEKQVRDIFKRIKDLQKQSAHSVADWERRFESMIVKVKEANAA